MQAQRSLKGNHRESADHDREETGEEEGWKWELRVGKGKTQKWERGEEGSCIGVFPAKQRASAFAVCSMAGSLRERESESEREREREGENVSDWRRVASNATMPSQRQRPHPPPLTNIKLKTKHLISTDFRATVALKIM